MVKKKTIAKSKVSKPKKQEINTARVLTSPTANACLSIEKIFESTQPNQQALCDQLFSQTDKVVEKGDNTLVESMLLAQAQTLQAMFHMAVRRMENAVHMPNRQAYSEIAFKANNACRKSLLALQQIKNPVPSATFIKQQNNAVNQQINNDQAEEKKINSGNKLLEIKDAQRLDTRTTSSTINANPQLVSVESIYGAKDK